ncbi:MAG: ABC transporter permease [Caldilineaceae bacterium]|jgi:ABC-2 type transport system permease protein|nr:ABC transporter permease [Caldilineaceae bacterium]
MWNRLSSLIRKEFIQIIRDPRTLGMTFVMPVAMMFLLGYAATNDVRNIALVVLDQDQTSASRRLIDAYRVADYFSIAQPVASEDEMRGLIDNNTARAGLIIPPGYGRDLAGGESAEVAFVLDGSDPTVASTALSAAQFIGQSLSTQVSLDRLQARGQTVMTQQPIDIRTQVWFNPGLVNSYYMVPAMIGIILQYLTTMLTATSIVRERERGTIEQLIVTPLRSWELVVGKLTPYVLIAFLNTIEVLTIGVLLFHVPINGSLPLLLALTSLFLVTTLGTGLFISSIANTQQEAMLTTMFTLLPSIFLSGFFFPLAAMPGWLQVLSYLIPLRYFLIMARGIVLKGVGMAALWPEVVALSIFALVVMGAAVSRFRKSLD